MNSLVNTSADSKPKRKRNYLPGEYSVMADGTPIRTKTCPCCGKSFNYPVRRGNDRRFCSRSCCRSHHLALRCELQAAMPRCKIDGCRRLATRAGVGLCEACYCHFRRTGGFTSRAISLRTVTKEGYVRLLKPDHPLADCNGYVYEHRLVLYESQPTESPECFWCGRSLTWKKLSRLSELS
jgi:hypothetical protein